MDLGLSYNKVHIWHASLEATTERLYKFQNALSNDEKRRAERFSFDCDREHFIVARGILRYILSVYSDREPSEHSFNYNPYGKPFLNNENSLCFSVSHSGGEALYAITLSREVGIDIECIQPFDSAIKIVEHFFSDREKKAFNTIPESLKTQAFFTCWTRKEAYLKALGKGLSHPLDKFSVSFYPGEPARFIPAQANMKEESHWTIKDILVNAGYVAAVAVEGYNLHFHHWQWSW